MMVACSYCGEESDNKVVGQAQRYACEPCFKILEEIEDKLYKMSSDLSDGARKLIGQLEHYELVNKDATIFLLADILEMDKEKLFRVFKRERRFIT